VDVPQLAKVLLQEEASAFLQAEIAIVALLATAAIVAILARRLRRMPYTVALVLAGLALTFLSPDLLNLGERTGEVILLILVPPLVFEATLHIKWRDLRADLSHILMLAVVGSLLGAVVVALPIAWLLGFPPLAAFTFGALIAATDPVAVISFFRSLGVTKRLALLVEGESLFNDGVAIVLFTVALGAAEAALSGNGGAFSFGGAVLSFIRVAFGGLFVGITLGFAVSYVILKNVDDHLIETGTTVAVAFGAFVVAEQFHLSGILAVVAAGIFVGNIGSQSTSPTTQLTLNNFWEFLAFTANSLVFLLIGLQTEIGDLVNSLDMIVVAILAVLLSRSVVVYGLTWLSARLLPRHPIPMRFRHVMFWGGLRGAISLALAFKLTEQPDIFGRELTGDILVLTFGVVLFTLLAQATTLRPLLSRLELTKQPFQYEEKQRQQAWLLAKRAGRAALDRLHDEGLLAEEVWRAMAIISDGDIETSGKRLIQHLQTYSELKQEMVLEGRDEILRAERSAVADAARRGVITDEIADELIRQIDKRSTALSLLRESAKRPQT
jgi:CPA1 family monovalent cation:H+ antiporter